MEGPGDRGRGGAGGRLEGRREVDGLKGYRRDGLVSGEGPLQKRRTSVRRREGW